MPKFANLNEYIDKSKKHQCIYDGGMIGPSHLVGGVDVFSMECVICGKYMEVQITKRLENLIIMHNTMGPNSKS